MKECNTKKAANKKWKVIAIAFACIITIVLGGIFTYLMTYYKAVDVDEYMASTAKVKVTKISQGYFFDGEGEEDAIIFYPGAKVDEKAYAPILKNLAEQGMDCFLVKMPFHFAIFGLNRGEEILNAYDYENYYMAGHSLGGAMAAKFVSSHTSDFKGIIFLAAYSVDDLSGTGLKCLSIWGDQDQVYVDAQHQEERKNLPADTVYFEIPGANHAGFGSYGEQKGDGSSTIGEEQWNITVDKILNVYR